MAGFFSKERIIAPSSYNRWLIPPAALAVHLCIGMAYGFSVFWKPLGNALMGSDGKPLAACAAGATTFAEKLSGTGRALFATDCNWTQFDLGWMYTLFFVLLGCSAALWGGWLERSGPRKAGSVATLCWTGGLLISAFGVYTHQLWMMWLGSGVIGGVGLGLGYISPVSTLIKWFPDRRGMATGLAIMGFGGGALVGSPIATKLMTYFATPTEVGVWQTFVVLAVVYAVFMLCGSLGYRVPPTGWQPEGWTPPAAKATNGMIATRHVHLKNAHKTPQFWLLWLVLCMNVSASIGIIGAAAPMLQETFGGILIHQPDIGFADIKADDALTAAAAAIAAGFVGLISLFNIFGRIAWATSSDKLGRKQTYFIFFVLGALLYSLASYGADVKSLAIFGAALCVIVSMYGGGLEHIHHLGHRGNVLFVVNVRQNGHTKGLFDLAQDLKTPLHARPSKAHPRRAVGFVVTRLEDEGNTKALADLFQGAGRVHLQLFRLHHTGASDQEEGLIESNIKATKFHHWKGSL